MFWDTALLFWDKPIAIWDKSLIMLEMGGITVGGSQYFLEILSVNFSITKFFNFVPLISTICSLVTTKPNRW